jgi:hypothetical protein
MMLFSDQTNAKNSSTQSAQAQIDLIIERLTNSQGLDDLNESLDAFSDLKIAKNIKQQSGKVIVPLLSELLCAEYNDEAVVQRVLTVLIDLCNKDNALLFLDEHASFEVLLQCLAHNNTLVQIHTIELMLSLLNFHREKVEQSLLSCNLGMRCLMDVVAVSEQVHVKVRNDMLSLLKALTLYNDRIKEFISFSHGFELLFDIIDQEQSSGQLSLDCLGLAKNLLSENTVTKKWFAQSPVVTRLPELISDGFLPSSPSNSTNNSYAASMSSSSTTTTAATTKINNSSYDMPSIEILNRSQYTVNLILELLSCTGSGNDRIKLLTSLTSTKSPDPQNFQKVSELQHLQQAICNPHILCSLLQVVEALKMPFMSIGGSTNETVHRQNDLRDFRERLISSVFNALASLLCGNSSNQAMFASSKIILPWGPQRVVTNVGCLTFILDVYMKIQSNIIHDAVLGVLDAFFCLNEDAKVSIIGHAIAPPPAVLDGEQNQSLPCTESPGTMIVSVFKEAGDNLMNSSLSISDREVAQFSFNAACDVLEKVYSNNVTCKELLLRVKVSSTITPSSNPKPIFFLEYCFRLIRETISNNSNVPEIDVSSRLMQLLATWVYTSSAVVDTIFQSATYLSVLANVFKKNYTSIGMENRLEKFCALFLAVCLATGSGNPNKNEEGNDAIFGFVENVLGVEGLNDMLDDVVSKCVERTFVTFIEKVRIAATEKIVKRYTGSGNAHKGGGGRITNSSGIEEIQKLRTKIRELEEDKRSCADLFVLLAHLDLENRVLLKHLQNLGGSEALKSAKEEARSLLQSTKGTFLN